ncbi:hypothetical protein B0T17DRAFT_97174 [Bombardia bombarda]|uniref:Uncharacterized protein n=1 Tax=Bombardia bombarda TaxID=252184 RepID=A0AA39XN17_9PEZI|nr:hypothetical protein B0T17DRAFT_97174 [Bombardia bombarda]
MQPSTPSPGSPPSSSTWSSQRPPAKTCCTTSSSCPLGASTSFIDSIPGGDPLWMRWFSPDNFVLSGMSDGYEKHTVPNLLDHPGQRQQQMQTFRGIKHVALDLEFDGPVAERLCPGFVPPAEAAAAYGDNSFASSSRGREWHRDYRSCERCGYTGAAHFRLDIRWATPCFRPYVIEMYAYFIGLFEDLEAVYLAYRGEKLIGPEYMRELEKVHRYTDQEREEGYARYNMHATDGVESEQDMMERKADSFSCPGGRIVELVAPKSFIRMMHNPILSEMNDRYVFPRCFGEGIHPRIIPQTPEDVEKRQKVQFRVMAWEQTQS